MNGSPKLPTLMTLPKVIQSRNDFSKPMFLPKNEQMNSTLLQWNLRSACFCSFFWKKLKTPKRHFEINWPLVIPASCARLNESKYTSDTSEPTRTTRSFFDLIWGPWHFSKLQMPTSIYEKFQKSCQLFAFLEFWLY